MSTKRRFYILFVSRDADGTLNKVPVPLHYAYIFVAAAVIGLFTITGLAGSYTRMLVKTARFNQLRHDHQTLQNDYAHLEKQAHERDVQAASLGSLATEVSALYGMTTGKLTSLRGASRKPLGGVLPGGSLKDAPGTIGNDSYLKSVDAFYTLRDSALNGDTTRLLAPPVDLSSERLGRIRNPLMPGQTLGDLGADRDSGPLDETAFTPSIWPVTGPISSGFGEREDPILGSGEGEFHPGVDITGALGTPIHATADGLVTTAGMVNGYGRMVRIDHGHGVQTGYGHMSGFAVTEGQSVVRGQVIGYIGHSGRTTGNHVHYEVRIQNVPVNPHKYLRTTLAEFEAKAAPAF